MRSTQYFYLTLLLVIFLSSCTQKESKNNIVDSSSDSLDIYFSLANDLNLPRDDRQAYSVRALDVVSNLKNDSINRVNLFKVANRFYNISNWKDFNNTVRLVLENSTEANDSVSIAKAFTYLGNYYESNTSHDSAFIFYNKAERIYDDLKDKMSLGKILFIISWLF